MQLFLIHTFYIRYKKFPRTQTSGIVGISGADSRTRTGDPILTMDVLYLLS